MTLETFWLRVNAISVTEEHSGYITFRKTAVGFNKKIQIWSLPDDFWPSSDFSSWTDSENELLARKRKQALFINDYEGQLGLSDHLYRYFSSNISHLICVFEILDKDIVHKCSKRREKSLWASKDV